MKQKIWLTALCVSWLMSFGSQADELPAPIQSLADRGLEIIDTFETPTELQGYAAEFQGRALAVYLTPDGEHAILGNMINAEGEDIGSEALYELVSGPQQERAWGRLENADYVVDGDSDAERIVYTITDPNCPYCHQFREAAEPWIEAGEVQLRHLMVGVIREESLAQAATIVGHPQPADALQSHRERRERGGIETVERHMNRGEQTVQQNNQLMRQLGHSSTPTTYYRDENGHVQVVQGMPQGLQLEAILGPRP